jgi:hypothetical protein
VLTVAENVWNLSRDISGVRGPVRIRVNAGILLPYFQGGKVSNPHSFRLIILPEVKLCEIEKYSSVFPGSDRMLYR